MEQQLKSILTEAARETLEKLAFLFTFPEEERDGDAMAPAVFGRVGFNGYFGGSLLMGITESTMPEIAANMLGLDDDAEISDAEQQDALKEILNVICGNVLPAIAGEKVEFNIETPEILSEKKAARLCNDNRAACVLKLMLEEGRCDLYLFIRGELPEMQINNDTG